MTEQIIKAAESFRLYQISFYNLALRKIDDQDTKKIMIQNIKRFKDYSISDLIFYMQCFAIHHSNLEIEEFRKRGET